MKIKDLDRTACLFCGIHHITVAGAIHEPICNHQYANWVPDEAMIERKLVAFDLKCL
ncbi:hypothetical protein LCGC14_3114660, partial [marine sediment metagenome]